MKKEIKQSEVSGTPLPDLPTSAGSLSRAGLLRSFRSPYWWYAACLTLWRLLCLRALPMSCRISEPSSAYILFAVGVIGTGLLAIPVLSGSLSYIITETFGWEEGLDRKFHSAKAFYIIIAISLILGLSLNYIGISPIKALIYSALLYGLTAPVLIAVILHISNNKKIMGKNTNGKTSNIPGFATLVLMTIPAVILVYMQLTEK